MWQGCLIRMVVFFCDLNPKCQDLLEAIPELKQCQEGEDTLYYWTATCVEVEE